MQPHPGAAGVAAAVAREPRAGCRTDRDRPLRACCPTPRSSHACLLADFDTVEALELAAVVDRLILHYRIALTQLETAGYAPARDLRSRRRAPAVIDPAVSVCTDRRYTRYAIQPSIALPGTGVAASFLRVVAYEHCHVKRDLSRKERRRSGARWPVGRLVLERIRATVRRSVRPPILKTLPQLHPASPLRPANGLHRAPPGPRRYPAPVQPTGRHRAIRWTARPQPIDHAQHG
jgi:hypothetical protein